MCIRPSPFSAGDQGAGLLITPESVLLHPGGSVSVLPGLHDGTESKFSAPETTRESPRNHEKVRTSDTILMTVWLGTQARAAVALPARSALCRVRGCMKRWDLSSVGLTAANSPSGLRLLTRSHSACGNGKSLGGGAGPASVL